MQACPNAASPVNLVQANTKPCNQLCEFTINDSFPSTIQVNDEPILQFTASPAPTATWNGQTVTLSRCEMYSPSQHRLEGNVYDAEFIMYFAAGDVNLAVSVFVSTSTRSSASQAFFNAFMAKVNTKDEPLSVGRTWSLSHVLPVHPTYFIYTGSTMGGSAYCGQTVTWVVHKFPVNIHPDDLAMMQREYPGETVLPIVPPPSAMYFNPGRMTKMSRETLEVNDTAGTYMRCRAKTSGPANSFASASPSNLTLTPPKGKTVVESAGAAVHGAHEYITSNGGYYLFGRLVMAILFTTCLVFSARFLAIMIATSNTAFISNTGFASLLLGARNWILSTMVKTLDVLKPPPASLAATPSSQV